MAPLNDDVFSTIVETLCLHCGPQQQHDSAYCFGLWCAQPCRFKHEERARVTALAALCRTSKEAKKIATPHLYHRPTTERGGSLLCTLLGHPDLSRHVKHLSSRYWELDEPDLTSTLAALMPQRMRDDM